MVPIRCLILSLLKSEFVLWSDHFKNSISVSSEETSLAWISFATGSSDMEVDEAQVELTNRILLEE
jgi:hypothetical protein